MNEIELATLSGFFAGEGNITVSGGKWPTLYAAIGNTEKLWVERFHTLWGGSFYIEQPKYANAKHMFRWRVSGKTAVKFLTDIKPFLIGEKAAQLVVGLELQEIKASVHPPTPYTSEQTLLMEKVHQKMQSLRRTAAETNRKDASPGRSDSPILGVIPEPITVRREGTGTF